MPRRGPPSSFGWMLSVRCPNPVSFDIWERPDGFSFAVPKGAWFEQDGEWLEVIDPPVEWVDRFRHA